MRLAAACLTLLLCAGAIVVAQDKPKLSAVGFAGGIATLESPSELWPAEYLCVPIHVFATGAIVPSVLAVVGGMGSSTVSAGRPRGTCDAPAAGDQVRLELANVDRAGQWITIRVPVSLFPTGGDLEGDVRLYAGGEAPVEVPLKLQARGQHPFTQAVMWFLGIAIPGLVALVLGRWAYVSEQRFTARSAADAAFERYVVQQRDALDTLFTVFMPTLRNEPDAAKWSDEVKAKLDEHLESIPPRHRGRLLAALGAHNRATVINELARTFPNWSARIKECQ
jgi:hypothetical protein